VEYQGHSFHNPLFNQLARYAGRFAQPVYYADPGAEGHAAFKNGSGFFVRLARCTVAVTCHHVLSDYRRRRSAVGSSFEFGRLSIDPEQYVLAESQYLDLVTLDVSGLVGRPGGVDPAWCVDPYRWPPGDVDSDDVLAFAGFPGLGREQVDPDYFRFHAFSAGTTAVASKGGPDHLYTQIDLEHSIMSGVRPDIAEDLGGVSGGPLFVWRKTPILIPELVGVVIEYQAGLDLLYVRRAACLRDDGTISSLE
jgi:hypothetical protein